MEAATPGAGNREKKAEDSFPAAGRPAPLEAVILFKDAEEAGGRDFLKVLLINTLAQTYARHTNYKH